MRFLLTGICLAAAFWGALALWPDSTEQNLATSLHELDEVVRNSAVESRKQSETKRPVISETGPFPEAFVAEPAHTFGTMAISTRNSHRFVIENRGEAALEMQAGETTCKCTTFGFESGDADAEPLEHLVIAPGEQAVLLVNWKSGENPDRAFRHGGSVYTNDPENTEIRLTVEGAVEAPWEILPQTLWDLGNMYDEPAVFEAAIGSKLYSDLQITDFSCSSEHVELTHVPMTVDKLIQGRFQSGHVLTVNISEKIASGLFDEEVQILTSVSAEPIRVQLKVRKFGAIRVQGMAGTILNPETLTLRMGSFSAAEGKSVKLLLIVDEQGMDEPFAITEQQMNPSFLKASLQPLGQTGTVHRYQVTLECPAGRPATQRTLTQPGSIRLMTNHPSGDSISLGLHMYSN